MIVYMGGSGAIRRIRACKAPGSVVGVGERGSGSDAYGCLPRTLLEQAVERIPQIMSLKAMIRAVAEEATGPDGLDDMIENAYENAVGAEDNGSVET
ncbi:hypothetical protein AK812_SmicGene45992 [Symbiodinium microadriaticum]|uniref:Uncharacterized protein n=1 Tax=Symbiodinium microadriaticum TaxID=2951 RepID=A0A1Q9BUX5_SYMMI|nr:hypothetical protein AK812_SmicGene45992 [Symbiodinium microadriaticum]